MDQSKPSWFAGLGEDNIRWLARTSYVACLLLAIFAPRPLSSLAVGLLILGVAIAVARTVRLRPLMLVSSLPRIPFNAPAISSVSVGVAVVMVCIGTFFFSVGGQDYAETGLGWSVTGGLLMGAALVLNPPVIGRSTASYATPRQRRTRWIPMFAGIILLLALAEINGNFFDPTFLTYTTTHVQFVLWVIAPLLLAYGVAGKRLKPPGRQEIEHDVGARYAGITSERRDDYFLTKPHPPAPSPLRREEEHPGSRRLVKSPLQALGRGFRGGVRKYQHDYPASLRERVFSGLPIVLIVLLALFVRVWQLDSGAPFFIDEIHFSNTVQHFYNSDEIELLLPFSSVAAFPYLYPYMQWLNVEIFGRNLVGLRMASVLFGVANVYALYLLARELSDRKTALIAAGLLAVFPPHIHFSRMGLNNIADPAFGTLALYFIARGLNSARSMRVNFAWAGAMLGLTQYFYEGGRLLFPALVIWWLMGLAVLAYIASSGKTIFAWWRTYTRRDIHAFESALRRLESIPYRQFFTAVVVMLVVTVLVAAPVYYTLVGQEREFMSRLDTAGLRENTRATMTDTDGFLQHFVNRFYESFLIHTTIPEAGYYYRGETGLLPAVMTPFFILGAAYALWRVGTFTYVAGALLVLLWIVFTWLGNTLMQESRIAPRYVVEFPALCLLVALGVRAVVDGLVGFTPSPLPVDREGERVETVGDTKAPSLQTGSPNLRAGFRGGVKLSNRVLAATISAMVVVNVWYYFEPHLTTFRQQFRDAMNRDAHDVVLRSADFPPDTHVYFISSTPYPERDSSDLLAFLNPDVTIYTKLSLEVDETYMQALIADRNRAFFVEPDNQRIIDLLHQFNDNLEGPFYSPQDMPVSSQYVLYWTAGQRDDFLPDEG